MMAKAGGRELFESGSWDVLLKACGNHLLLIGFPSISR
jgi:hypothetical protein